MDTITHAKKLASRLGSLNRDEWRIIGTALDEIKGSAPSRKFGQIAEREFPTVTPAKTRTHAMWLARSWAEIEPFFEPGQPLAGLHHPQAIREAFDRLNVAEDPVDLPIDAPPVKDVGEPVIPPAADRLAAVLTWFADAGLDEAAALRFIRGSALTLRPTDTSQVLAAREFDTAEDAAAYLEAASLWRNAGGRSVAFRASKMRKAAPDKWPTIAKACIKPGTGGGRYVVDLRGAEDGIAAEVAERAALMAVPGDEVVFKSPCGHYAFRANDNPQERARTGLVTGILYSSEGGESCAIEASVLAGWVQGKWPPRRQIRFNTAPASDRASRPASFAPWAISRAAASSRA